MSPVEDDPDMWAAAIRFCKQLFSGLDFMLPYIAPAFLGSLIGLKQLRARDRRKLGFIATVSLLFWSTLGGAALVPLASSLTGLPEAISNSIGVALGILGANGTNALVTLQRARKVLKDLPDDSDADGDGDRKQTHHDSSTDD